MELLVGSDLAELAAPWIAERAERGGEFRIALTGGSTPAPVYDALSRFQLRWNDWHVWWSDERLVPPDHPDSNERLARESLLDHVPVPEPQIRPLRSLDVELPDRFDLVLLGVGRDGHTASLFPGDPALAATAPVAHVERPALPPYHPRLTLTYPVINAARAAALLVSGGEKRDVLAHVLAGDESLPAARVRAAETVVFADEAAVR